MNETNCTSLGTGSFSIIDPPKYGSLRFSAQLAAVPEGRPCAGMRMPVSIAYYTWTETLPASLQDVFKIEYTTADRQHSDITIGVANENDRLDVGGNIQIQGPGAEGKEIYLSWKWPPPQSPPTVSLALAKLQTLANRLSNREYNQRNIALIDAEEYIEACGRNGGCGPRRRSFQNPAYRGKGEQRVDVNIFRGIAFIPG